MTIECSFELNNPNAIYNSGDTIAGKIVLSTTTVENVKEIFAIFVGAEQVKWNGNRCCKPFNISYQSRKVYINNNFKMHSAGRLLVGTYIYPFIITLPSECPTSFEGRYGFVRYELSLKIIKAFRSDKVFTKPVKVIKTIDLNLCANNKLPLLIVNSSSSCCWPCAQGKIIYNLMIPLSAYVPRQSVKYTIFIFNQSKTDTRGYFMEFVKKTTFTSTSSRQKRCHENILLMGYFPEKCVRQSNRNIEGTFIVPITTATTEKSSIIQIEYFLRVKIHLWGYTSNSVLIAPLIIGTVPIKDV